MELILINEILLGLLMKRRPPKRHSIKRITLKDLRGEEGLRWIEKLPRTFYENKTFKIPLDGTYI